MRRYLWDLLKNKLAQCVVICLHSEPGNQWLSHEGGISIKPLWDALSENPSAMVARFVSGVLIRMPVSKLYFTFSWYSVPQLGRTE